jgi:hypothetical protein
MQFEKVKTYSPKVEMWRATVGRRIYTITKNADSAYYVAKVTAVYNFADNVGLFCDCQARAEIMCQNYEARLVQAEASSPHIIKKVSIR